MIERKPTCFAKFENYSFMAKNGNKYYIVESVSSCQLQVDPGLVNKADEAHRQLFRPWFVYIICFVLINASLTSLMYGPRSRCLVDKFILLVLLSASLVDMSTAAGTFHYFAFGSNLLAKRIHIQNPSAVRRGYGYLKDYSLDFFHYAARWKGAPATIVEQEGSKVWGAIWEIDDINLADLDRQEGVHNSVYKPLTLPVVLPTGATLDCRVYQLVKNPCCLAPDADRPYERQPSKTYMNIIINGAIETGLPDDYIELLKRIKHNGNTGDPQLSLELEKPIEE